MTLKEKLLGATRIAAEAYNLGQAPSAAVIKAAKDFNLISLEPNEMLNNKYKLLIN